MFHYLDAMAPNLRQQRLATQQINQLAAAERQQAAAERAMVSRLAEAWFCPMQTNLGCFAAHFWTVSHRTWGMTSMWESLNISWFDMFV